MSYKTLSITRKITILGIAIALSVASLIGITALLSAKTIIEQRMIQSELPSKLHAINNYISLEINELLSAAEQVSSNHFILAWANSRDNNDDVLIKELNRLVKQYGLATASWANRDTAQYWNQDGFLRVLDRQQDGWFFDFKNANQAYSISLYQEPNGDTKMFVNHQQINGIGLTGLAKSIDDMQALLNKFTIEQTGFVFITDDKGVIKLH